MSRIGKMPIKIPNGVTVKVDANNHVNVKGPLGELKEKINSQIKVVVTNEEVILTRSSEEKTVKSLHGLYRALVNNMVEGVSKGFTTKQELVGVGYKATATGQILEMSLGYSHDIILQFPPEIKVQAVTEKRSNPIITLTSCDKQLLGQVAAKLRSFRKPEPYKGKGIRFVGEVIKKKAGKTAVSSST